MASPVSVQTVSAPAAAPYAPPPRTVGWAARQYLGLVHVMLLEYRSTWFFHLLFGCLMPLGMLFLFRFAGFSLARESAIFLLGGNLTTAIVFGPTSMVIWKIGWGRESRVFDYWTALPLPKVALVLAIVTVSLLFAFPGLAGVYLLGSLLLGIPLSGGLALIPLIPLAALSLVGFGAFLGAYARDGQVANHIANMLMAVVIFLSPMMIPPEAMPAPLRMTAMLMPTTYAADAFRSVLGGNFGPHLAYDVLILLGFAAGFLTLVHRKLDWRAS